TASALSVKFQQKSIHLQRAESLLRDWLVAPLRSPGAALVAPAEMDADRNFGPPFNILNLRVVRRDRRIQRLCGIDAARLQRCPALWVEESGVRRRVQLNIGSAFVDQRLDLVAHDHRDILKHVVNGWINLVAYPGFVPAYGMLGRGRRADFERARRMLFQKRRLAWSEAGFLEQFIADDELEIAFL